MTSGRSRKNTQHSLHENKGTPLSYNKIEGHNCTRKNEEEDLAITGDALRKPTKENSSPTKMKIQPNIGRDKMLHREERFKIASHKAMKITPQVQTNLNPKSHFLTILGVPPSSLQSPSTNISSLRTLGNPDYPTQNTMQPCKVLSHAKLVNF